MPAGYESSFPATSLAPGKSFVGTANATEREERPRQQGRCDRVIQMHGEMEGCEQYHGERAA